MKWIRSAAAVIAGFLAMAIGVGLITFVIVTLMFESMDAPPTPMYLAINIAYSFGCAVLGGAVAARLAPGQPLGHALVLAALVLLLNVGTLTGSASAAPGQPVWYPLLMVVLAVTGICCGGWMAARSSR